MPAPLPPDSKTTHFAASEAGAWSPPEVETLQAMLPQYEIVSMLGRGGMGAVYKGRQKSLDRLVAIKILPPGLGDDEAKFKERFQNEARTMAKLMHPGIVAVFDFGETDWGQLYFVMEYINGTDVAQMIRAGGPLLPEEALTITAHVCDALTYAHSSGIIHRDIKPANILINRQGQVKVADFGLAKADDPSLTSGLTKTGHSMGTPDFVAPEALLPGTTVDGRADLYAIGVMLYQMLTGEIPRGLFLMPGVRTNGGIDPRFDRIITRAMQTDPAQRYQAAAEIRMDLDRIATTPLVRQEASAAVAAVPEQAGQNPQSKRSPFAAIIGIFAVVIAAAGFAVFSGSGKPEGGSHGGEPAKPASAVAATDGWTDSLAEWWEVNGKTEGVEASLAREPGGFRVRNARSVLAWEKGGNLRDVAIRATVSGAEAVGLRFFLRAGGERLHTRYAAILRATGKGTVLLERGDAQPAVVLAEFSAPAGFNAADRNTVEFRAQGDTLTFLLNGKTVASVRDNTLTTGRGFLGPGTGMLIEKFEYRELGNEAAPAPEPATPGP